MAIPRQKQILSLAVLLDQLHGHLFGRNELQFADNGPEHRRFFKSHLPLMTIARTWIQSE